MTLVRCVRYIFLVLLCVTQVSQQAFCIPVNSESNNLPSNVAAESIKKGKEKLEKLGREAVDSLVVGTLEGQALHSKFIELYQRDFDEKKIASLMLGTYWPQMNEAQKKSFLDIQPRKLANIYSSKFHEYQGVNFKVIRGWTNNAKQKTIVIETSVKKPGGEPLKVNWYLTADYKIYDIVIEGVSMVKTFRDQYISVLHNEGVAGFLSSLGANSVPANEAAAAMSVPANTTSTVTKKTNRTKAN